MLSQGAMALGGIVWGAAAVEFGTRATLLAIGGLFVASLALARRWSLDLDLPAPPAAPAGPFPRSKADACAQALSGNT
jgi:hypothetical protein